MEAGLVDGGLYVAGAGLVGSVLQGLPYGCHQRHLKLGDANSSSDLPGSSLPASGSGKRFARWSDFWSMARRARDHLLYMHRRLAGRSSVALLGESRERKYDHLLWGLVLLLASDSTGDRAALPTTPLSRLWESLCNDVAGDRYHGRRGGSSAYDRGTLIGFIIGCCYAHGMRNEVWKS